MPISTQDLRENGFEFQLSWLKIPFSGLCLELFVWLLEWFSADGRCLSSDLAWHPDDKDTLHSKLPSYAELGSTETGLINAIDKPSPMMVFRRIIYVIRTSWIPSGLVMSIRFLLLAPVLPLLWVLDTVAECLSKSSSKRLRFLPAFLFHLETQNHFVTMILAEILIVGQIMRSSVDPFSQWLRTALKDESFTVISGSICVTSFMFFLLPTIPGFVPGIVAGAVFGSMCDGSPRDFWLLGVMWPTAMMVINRVLSALAHLHFGRAIKSGYFSQSTKKFSEKYFAPNSTMPLAFEKCVRKGHWFTKLIITTFAPGFEFCVACGIMGASSLDITLYMLPRVIRYVVYVFAGATMVTNCQPAQTVFEDASAVSRQAFQLNAAEILVGKGMFLLILALKVTQVVASRAQAPKVIENCEDEKYGDNGYVWLPRKTLALFTSLLLASLAVFVFATNIGPPIDQELTETDSIQEFTDSNKGIPLDLIPTIIRAGFAIAGVGIVAHLYLLFFSSSSRVPGDTGDVEMVKT